MDEETLEEMVLLRERVVQLETQGQQPGGAVPGAAFAVVAFDRRLIQSARQVTLSCSLCFTIPKGCWWSAWVLLLYRSLCSVDSTALNTRHLPEPQPLMLGPS